MPRRALRNLGLLSQRYFHLTETTAERWHGNKNAFTLHVPLNPL